MKVVDRKEPWLVIGSIIGIVASLVGLLADIPAVSQTFIGKVILFIILFGAVGYLATFFYNQLLVKLIRAQRCLKAIQKDLIDFVLRNENNRLDAVVDNAEIKLIEKTKHAKSLPLHIQELERLAERDLRIKIDKGHNDGIVDTMKFKVFHNSQMHEIGVCPCTTFEQETTLVVTVREDCPVQMHEFTYDSLVIYIVDHEPSNEVNHLIANLLYKIDYE